MKGTELFNILDEKEKKEFKHEFEWGNNKTLKEYLNEDFENLYDFLIHAFDWGVNDGYWQSIVNYYERV